VSFDIDLEKEARFLGFEGVNNQSSPITPRIAVFESTLPAPEGKKVLLYVSEGARPIPLEDRVPGQASVEFVAQVCVNTQQNLKRYLEQIPKWPLRSLALACLLLSTSRSGSLRPGAMLSCSKSLGESHDTRLNTILLTRFAPLPYEQLKDEGPFNYLNVLAVTEDEAQVARLYSADHLMALLKYRGLDQVLRHKRSSVVARTGLLVESEQGSVNQSNASKAGMPTPHKDSSAISQL